VPRPVRYAHVFSSALGIPASQPYVEPFLARGWELTAICPDGPEVAEAVRLGWRWLPLDWSRRMDPVGDARGSLRLYRDLRSERLDIVHTHNVKPGLAGRVVAGLARTPIILHTLHGLVWSLETAEPKQTVHAAMERIASLRCDAVFAQSEEDRAAYLARRIMPAEQVVLVGNGVDVCRFDPARHDEASRATTRRDLGVGPDEVLFLAPGRLVQEKGISEVVEAALQARAVEPRVRVAICGREEVKADAVPRTTLERGERGGVLLLGLRSDMDALIAATDVVVLASHREGLPRALIEGAVMGKPLVATDIRGCREVVRPGENGLLVPVRDARALAEAFIRLARDAPERERLGTAGLASARERYDLDRVVARMVAVIDGLVAHKLRPRAA
jgi:glycosyltransferase involved in cell wall biosynthesis